MINTNTVGTVTALKAEIVNPYSDKSVVGTRVTIETEVMVEDKVHAIKNEVFVEPNSTIPKIGDSIIITMSEYTAFADIEGTKLVGEDA